MAATMTPEQRAELALTDSHEFCNLLAQARQYRATGWWDGSAFRRHPCGLVVDTIKLTNHWHVDQLCTIEITDGAGWDTRGVCQDSFAHGDPHPKPIEGGSLTVWRCGKWADAAYEQALRPRIVEILTAAARHVAGAQADERLHAAMVQEDQRRRHEQMASAALARATGEARHG